VVLHREGEVGPRHVAALLLQLLERVRRMQLMQHVAVDIDQVAAIDAPRHEMVIPDLVEQRLGHGWNPGFELALRWRIVGGGGGDGKTGPLFEAACRMA
jgi:hypothetical protein